MGPPACSRDWRPLPRGNRAPQEQEGSSGTFPEPWYPLRLPSLAPVSQASKELCPDVSQGSRSP